MERTVCKNCGGHNTVDALHGGLFCEYCGAPIERPRRADADGKIAHHPHAFPNATCAGCGEPIKVPFIREAGKPVYCSDCFARMKSGR